jgi:hypothetical protein
MGMRTSTAATLALVVAMAIVGLAGCSDGDSGEDETVSAGVSASDDSVAPEDPGEPGEPEEPGDLLALPDAEPTVRGVIVSGDAGPELTDAEGTDANDDDYYAGAILSLGEGGLVVDAEGEEVGFSDVFDQPVELWLDACAESYPVQCTVLAARAVG